MKVKMILKNRLTYTSSKLMEEIQTFESYKAYCRK